MTVPQSPELAPTGDAPVGRLDGYLPSMLMKIYAYGISLVGLAYILDLGYMLDASIFQEQFFGLLYGLVFGAGFILLPASKRRHSDRVPVYDYLLSLTGLAVGLYIFFFWPSIVVMSGILTPDRIVASTIALAVILELTRRAFGLALVVLAVLFILYALFNYLIPGSFGGRGTSWARLSTFVYTDTNSILGLISSVVFGMVFAFMLFGRALFVTGGGNFFTDLSMALMGHRRGGPAKVSVIASSLFGTLSGSASGNVVVTGSITIPMMIKSGYRPQMAGAVEAVSSSGGGLMPPIMGATAFIMAEFLAVPYREVVIAALLPALFYYMAVYIQIDLEAGRLGLKGLPRASLPKVPAVLKAGWTFMIPLAALIYCLFVIFLSPAKSALIALLVIAVVSQFRKDRLGVRKLLDVLENTGTMMVEMGIIAAVAGIIVGIINLTGVGLLFSQELLALAGGMLFPLLILTAVASIILGMSMPVTASYVILAVLAAPALEGAGIPAMAAHLFIFYFAVMSFITPPVCVAAFVAARIAQAPPMATAWQSMKLAVVAYVVPFVFVYDQALILDAPLSAVALRAFTASIGFAALAVALQGYLFAKVGTWTRVLLGLAGLASVTPSLYVELPGVVVVVVILATAYVSARKATRSADAPSPRREAGV
jgi:TRAP transporter 4TM/12TM fusion protein